MTPLHPSLAAAPQFGDRLGELLDTVRPRLLDTWRVGVQRRLRSKAGARQLLTRQAALAGMPRHTWRSGAELRLAAARPRGRCSTASPGARARRGLLPAAEGIPAPPSLALNTPPPTLARATAQITSLKNLGLNIRRAKLDGAPGRKANTFYITDALTSEKITRSAQIEEIRMVRPASAGSGGGGGGGGVVAACCSWC